MNRSFNQSILMGEQRRTESDSRPAANRADRIDVYEPERRNDFLRLIDSRHRFAKRVPTTLKTSVRFYRRIRGRI